MLKYDKGIFHVDQNANGEIWLVGSSGLQTSIAGTFQPYSQLNGLKEAGYVSSFLEQNGNFWVVSISGNLYKYDSLKFHAYAFNDKIRPLITNRNISTLYFDSNRTLHLGTLDRGYYQVDSSGNITEIIGRMTIGLKPGIYYNPTLVNGQVFFFAVKQVNSHKDSVAIGTFNFQGDFKFKFQMGTPENPLWNHRSKKISAMEMADGKIWIAKSNRIAKIDSNYVEFDDLKTVVINDLAQDDNGKVWVASSHGIWSQYNDSNTLVKEEGKLKNAFVHSVFKDVYGGIWCATEKSGVHHIAHPGHRIIRSNGLAEDVIVSQDVKDSTLFMGLLDGHVGIYRDNEISILKEKCLNTISCVKYLENSDKLLVGTLRKLFEINNGRLLENELFSNSQLEGYVDAIEPSLEENSVWIGIGKTLILWNFDEGVVKKVDALSRIYTIKQDSLGVVWVGTLNGLYTFDNDVLTAFGSKETPRSSVATIEIFHGQIWLSMPETGIFNVKGGKLRQIFNRGMPIKMVRDFALVGDELWGHNNWSLVKIGFRSNDDSFPSAAVYADGGSVYTNAPTSLDVLNNHILFGTSNGLISYDHDYLRNKTDRPKFHFVQVMVDAKNTPLQNEYELSYRNNYLSILYSGFNYLAAEPVFYKYRMLGLSPAWVYNSKREIQFTTLRPNEYTFEICAVDKFGNESDISSISFSVSPPFYRTWWFITGLGFFLVGLTFLIYTIRVNRIKRKSELLEELHTSQHQALSARLNPHFIFNSLSSIYHFTLKNDKEKAAEYMSEYARLMRLVLENSGQNLVALQNEIEAITIYLELEKLRCNGKFQYSIQIPDSSMNLNPPIPSLMLQPYLENAIWHGLMPLESNEGKLMIAVNSEGRKTTIEIEDNGIGRAKAQILKTTNHEGFQSVGTDINLKRLELLNKLYKVDFKVNILDLKQGDTSRGTRVIIDVPTIS